MDNKMYRDQIQKIQNQLEADINAYIEYLLSMKKLPVFITLPDDYKIEVTDKGIRAYGKQMMTFDFTLSELLIIHKKLEDV